MELTSWTASALPVDDPVAAALLRVYFRDVVGRYHKRAATEDEVDSAMADDPSDDLALFVVANYEGTPAGCAGIRFPAPEIAELSRMFVLPELRGLGGGAVLLDAIEAGARARGAHAVRLDTRSDLIEARRLYTRHGYVEIDPYSDGPYAEHWFEKRLVNRPGHSAGRQASR